MSLYHEAECGHSVEFGRKCQQCAHAKHQAEIERLRSELAKAEEYKVYYDRIFEKSAVVPTQEYSCQVAERNRLKQAVEVFREALEAISCGCTGSDTSSAEYADLALERGDAILKGEDAEKEDGK